MKNERGRLLKEIVSQCVENSAIKNELLFISLLGSSQTNEAVEGYSDLDILFIFRSNKYGTIQKSTLLELKKLSEKVSGKNDNDIEVSLLAHTIFDFEEYVDFEYLIHYSWGKVLFGAKKSYKKLFDSIISKKYSEKIRKDLMYYNLIHARFNLIRHYVSWNKFNKDKYVPIILKLIIDKVIEICDWALIYKGIFKKTKKEILENFSNNFQLGKYGHIPNQAYKIRANWNYYNFTEKELSKFIDESVLFVQELIEIVYEER
jgi:hypothetical protein